MNPYITRLQPYPFERLATLISGIEPPTGKAPIPLFIGEPRHPPPAFIIEALARYTPDGLAHSKRFAFVAVQILPGGVWIVMNGRVFEPQHVRKNRDANRFEWA